MTRAMRWREFQPFPRRPSCDPEKPRPISWAIPLGATQPDGMTGSRAGAAWQMIG
ncbi:hypothetical protein SAMN02990966_07432 [Rhodospirillales bacterium URHD0017]|nr:hypothetical protein SAMN02990966_07432 [Rhodospirillales bacterium URHD0017]